MDPSKMKVVDLRSELGVLGLDTKGNKPALVERLRKALEAKTGKSLPETSILDTSAEDADEPATPRRPGPAPRTTRRSSSSRIAQTPLKKSQDESPESITEEVQHDGSERYSPELDSEPENGSKSPQRESEQSASPPDASAPQQLEDEKSQSTDEKEDEQEPEDSQELSNQENVKSKDSSRKEDQEMENEEEKEKEDEKENEKENEKEKIEQESEKMDQDEDTDSQKHNRRHELTEEEEWEQLNERLQIREKERLEREKKQAEEDEKKLKEVSQDPIKLQRLKRKQDKKARWSNFYKTIAVTNEILTPPTANPRYSKHKKDLQSAEGKMQEPEINDDNVTLSWYDSDLNQYLELPGLNGVVPLSEGAFSHAWAGARGTHGVCSGRVLYEIRLGSVVTTTESVDKEQIASGLRVGWSTDDSSLHLGDGEFSWAYESTGRSVNNGEFKEYGKPLNEKDVVGVYLDLESNPCKISYTLNGVELGVAYEFEKSTLNGKALFPHILTKNMCYKVNFGYDRYNMITKTKIVRKRLEIPVEEVLEEKRRMEEELKRLKQEAIKRDRERREKERKDREERQKKKKEDRDKQDNEKKEKEVQEKKEEGESEDVVMEDTEKDKYQSNKDTEEISKDVDENSKDVEPSSEEAEVEKQEQSNENGEKAEETQPEEPIKPEPMQVEIPDVVDKNGEVKHEQPPVEVAPEVTEEDVFKGKTLDSRIKFVIRYTVEEELDGNEACLLPGFLFMCEANLEDGPRRPATKADCEVILMVGMPGVGKSHWARQHCASNPEKRYNILSTGALFDRMKVDCKPFRTTYEGRWDAMVSKCAKCVLKLLEIARGRRRNFILDQTNVYLSAQRRKLKEFDGYRRLAVVIVTDEETYRERQKRREQADGKEVPDGAVVDMKANFSIPEKCSWIDEVQFPELGIEEARQVVEGYHREAKAAGAVKERERVDREKRSRSSSRDQSRDQQPPNKRPRQRDRERDRPDDRWGGGGGGGGGGRWGPPLGMGGGGGGMGGGGGLGGGGGGRGGRWGGGGRDRSGPPPSRFDRNWGPPQGGRNDFGGRDRDGFRGGRNGPGGGRGDRGGGPPGARPPPLNQDRFGRDRPPRPMDRNDKRPPQGPGGGGGGLGGGGGGASGGGGGGGSGGGAGSWQRGGQVSNRGGGMQPARNNQHPGHIRPTGPNQNKQEGPNMNQQQNADNQQGWNQWTGGWGGWGNWNQNHQGWGNWPGNWANWGNQPGANAGQQGGGANQGQGNNKPGQANQQQQQGQQQQQMQQQWPMNYTAQQWYQWQQWQQQQQGWPGYQQGTQQGNTPDPQAWAQYCHQNYVGANAAGNTGSNSTPASDKK